MYCNKTKSDFLRKVLYCLVMDESHQRGGGDYCLSQIFLVSGHEITFVSHVEQSGKVVEFHLLQIVETLA